MTTKSQKPKRIILLSVLLLVLIMLIPAAAYASDDGTAEPSSTNDSTSSVSEPSSEPAANDQPAGDTQTETTPVEQNDSAPPEQPADEPAETDNSSVSDVSETQDQQLADDEPLSGEPADDEASDDQTQAPSQSGSSNDDEPLPESDLVVNDEDADDSEPEADPDPELDPEAAEQESEANEEAEAAYDAEGGDCYTVTITNLTTPNLIVGAITNLDFEVKEIGENNIAIFELIIPDGFTWSGDYGINTIGWSGHYDNSRFTLDGGVNFITKDDSALVFTLNGITATAVGMHVFETAVTNDAGEINNYAPGYSHPAISVWPNTPGFEAEELLLKDVHFTYNPDTSTNNHTILHVIWEDDQGSTYVAVSLEHNNDVVYNQDFVALNGLETLHYFVYSDANPKQNPTELNVDTNGANYSESADKWLVINLGKEDLGNTFSLTVDGKLGRGHDLGGGVATVVVTINSIIEASDAGKIYGEDDPATFEFSVYGLKSDHKVAVGTSPTITREFGEDVGTYVISIDDHVDLQIIDQDDNDVTSQYVFTYQTGTFTIHKKDLQVTAVAGDITYGDAEPTVTVEYDGFVSGDDASDLDDTGFVLGTNYTQGDDAGTYNTTIAIGTATDNNYNFTPLLTSMFEVGKKDLQVTAVAGDITYGDSAPTVTVEYSGFYGTDDADDLDDTGFVLGTNYTQGDDVGTYNTTIAIGTATDNNYNFTPLLTSTFEVGKKDLQVTAVAGDITYGDSAPTVTVEYSGFYGTDDADDLDDTGFVLGTNYTQGDDVGTYNTTIAIGTATDNNYNFTPLLTSTFEVGKKDLQVTAVAGDITYGDSAPTVTVEYSGFYGTDDADDLDDTGFVLGTNYTQGDDVGTYNTTIAIGTATDNNYNFTPLLTSMFEVGKKDLQVTAVAGDITYGDSAPTVTVEYSGFYGTDDADDLGDTGFVLGTNYTQGDDVGTYNTTIAIGTATDNNYNFTPLLTSTFEVGKRSITITAPDQGKVAGTADPEIIYSITGSLVEGDTISGSLSRELGETVGTYDIIKGTIIINDGNDGKNYDITFVLGEFTITAAPAGPGGPGGPGLPDTPPPPPPGPEDEEPVVLPLVAPPAEPAGPVDEGGEEEAVPVVEEEQEQEEVVLPEEPEVEPLETGFPWWLLLLLIPALIWFLLARLVLVRIPDEKEEGKYKTVARKIARRKDKRWYVDVEKQLDEYLMRHGEVLVDFRGGLIKEAKKAVYSGETVLGAGEVRFALINRSRLVTWLEDIGKKVSQEVG
ncbi:MAG: MBG domain-containing protein [Bacillota bacterium]|nr:MBG domain-containing protein [Bacillota bacterium]